MAYNSLTLVPAYGRDYKSKKSLLEDWQAGKDFLAVPFGESDSYTSIRDLSQFKADDITHLHFRYNGLTLVLVVKI